MNICFSKITLLFVSVAMATLAGCKDANIKKEYPKTRESRQEEKMGRITGEGLVLYGKKSGSSTEGINVNSYLWRAALDVVHTMPILSADPFGGTIFTDWYKMKINSPERYKLNIFIIGAELRSDALRVTVFKQKQDKNGKWQQVQVNKNLATQIENNILERAREIKTKSGS